MIPDPDLDPVTSGIVTPIDVLSIKAWIQIKSRVFSFLMIQDPDLNPVKSGIVTPLVGVEFRTGGKFKSISYVTAGLTSVHSPDV